MKKYELLNRHLCTIHVCNEPVEENLKSIYPFSLSDKTIIKKRLSHDGRVLCFIFENANKEKRLISSTLYVLNRYRNGTFIVKATEFTELIEMQDGQLLKSVLVNKNESENTSSIVITENEIKRSYGTKDLLIEKNVDEIKKETFLKISVLFLIVGIVLATIFIIFNIQKDKINAIREAENQEKLAAKQKSVEQEKCNKLKLEYEKLVFEKSVDMYQLLSSLYENIDRNASIENLSIEKNSFSIDIVTRDAIKILNNFEKNRAIQNIKMNKTTVQNGKEYVSYNGFFQRFIVYPSAESNSEQIKYYQAQIDSIKKREELKSSKTVSEYSEDLRKLLHSSNCREDYIQTKVYGDKVSLEVLINAKSEHILSFIKKVSKDEVLIDIQGLRIKNNQDYSNVQSLLTFDTGIIVEKENTLSESNITSSDISAKDFGASFYKNPERNHLTYKVAPKNEVKEKIEDKPRLVHNSNLEYVGEAKFGSAGPAIFLKDKEFGNLYKLPILETLNEANGCKILSSNSYEVVINKKHYEVKK